ncbi:MAG TPA: SMP-30/gluconolactonase/LRE family protein, partial [Actinomycetospora sp.]|nr:SMP-30/gluconolactonase/LRE family protein [Actinomycetospora sp.]
DGTLLTTGDAITRHEPGGAVVHREQGANEIAVDPRGHVYVDGADFDFLGGGVPEPGWIDLITHDGYSRRLADGIEFPNGMVVIRTAPPSSSPVVRGTPVRLRIGDDGSLGGRRVWAEGLGPDGIGIDAEGGIWVQTADTAAHTGDPRSPAGACVRLLDGGEITHGVETDLPCFSCVLGGREGRDLFLLCNEFEGVHRLTAVQQRRSARILVTDAPCPGAR